MVDGGMGPIEGRRLLLCCVHPYIHPSPHPVPRLIHPSDDFQPPHPSPAQARLTHHG